MLRWVVLSYVSFSVIMFASNGEPTLGLEASVNAFFYQDSFMHDATLWRALLGLFIVSLLYMLLSSYQIKRLTKAQVQMREKYTLLEEKQHTLLESMGKSIHSIATQTLSQTSLLAAKAKETPLHAEVQNVLYNENELLGATNDLIQFLQLKSKKVLVQNEVFNFSHVLNETIGLLEKTATKHHSELIFDVSKSVPNNLCADSSHLGQILTNLLEYSVQHSRTSKVHLVIDMEPSLTEEITLMIEIRGNLNIQNKETFFDTRYNEKSEEHIGFGLYIAKELVDLMAGTLSIQKSDTGDNIHIIIPTQKVADAPMHYQLSDTTLIDKKLLLVGMDMQASLALEKRFTYFNMRTTVISHEDFTNDLPQFANYGIVILDQALFTTKLIKILSLLKTRHKFKIIAVESLYNKSPHPSNEIIDLVIYKPFSPAYIFELLEGINSPTQDKSSPSKPTSSTLMVHKEAFEETPNIGLENFAHFAGKRLLLVEDNFINQKLIQSLLSKSNLTIEIASNGAEALSYLESNSTNIDFILMDINMPVMDGFTATEHIRQESKYDHIPIVSLTALVADYEIVKMFNIGMNGYLSKPIRLGKLYTAFNTFLKKQDITNKESTLKSTQNTMLEGLNTEVGLVNMHNNPSFYKEVLRAFMDAYEKSDIVFELLINKNRYTEAKKLCLDIKGLADTIGANEMSELSSEIYNHLIYNKYDRVQEFINQYKVSLATLKKSIHTYLEN